MTSFCWPTRITATGIASSARARTWYADAFVVTIPVRTNCRPRWTPIHSDAPSAANQLEQHPPAVQPPANIETEPDRRPQPSRRDPRGRRPSRGRALVDQLDLGNYYLFHAIRAELLERLNSRSGTPTRQPLAYAKTPPEPTSSNKLDILARHRPERQEVLGLTPTLHAQRRPPKPKNEHYVLSFGASTCRRSSRLRRIVPAVLPIAPPMTARNGVIKTGSVHS